MIIHGFTTERYVREVTVPAIERGLAKAGRVARRLRDLGSAVRRDRHQRRGDGERAKQGVQQQIAFYGSTPAYRRRARAARLGRPPARAQRRCRSRASGWRWASSSTTTMLNAFAVVAEPDQVGAELKKRYAGVVDRCSFYAPYRSRSRAVGRRDRRPEAGVVALSRRRGAGSTPRTRRGLPAVRSGRVRAITSSVRVREAFARCARASCGRDVGRRLAAHDDDLGAARRGGLPTRRWFGAIE